MSETIKIFAILRCLACEHLFTEQYDIIEKHCPYCKSDDWEHTERYMKETDCGGVYHCNIDGSDIE